MAYFPAYSLLIPYLLQPDAPGEHPYYEHPKGEHPKGEHPNDEHSNGVHTNDENNNDEVKTAFCDGFMILF